MEHPILKIKEINEDRRGYFGNSGSTKITLTLDIKSLESANTIDDESLIRDSYNFANSISKKWDNYNTSHRTGTPQRVGNQIIVPITVSHWTGD